MNDGERLKTLRNILDIKQGDFAKKISTTQGHISDIENGRKLLSDRTIKLICLESWNKKTINETWLRTGEGEIFANKTEDETLGEYMANIMYGEDDFLKNVIVKYMQLSDEHKKIIRSLFKD